MNTYKKIDLPIEVKDAQPHKPDIKWAWMTIGVIIWFCTLSFLAFHVFAIFIVSNINLEKEKEIFWNIFSKEMDIKKIEKYYTFQKNIPEFENYNIFVTDSPENNAFTYLWWNIILTTALLEGITYEEELIFVIAHEIWHVQSRHVLTALARDLPFKMTLLFLGVNIDLGFSNSTDMVVNVFSRKAENESDIIAIQIMKNNGLNTYCATPFFTQLWDISVEFMSSHPSNKSRSKVMMQWREWKNDLSDCTKKSLIKSNIPK